MIPAKHRRGKRPCKVCQSSPSRASADGRYDASSKSAWLSSKSSCARPSGLLRSTMTIVCSLESESYQPRANVLSGSPVGGSTLVTVAPRRANRDAATGPGVLILRLTTLMPRRSSGFSDMPAKHRAQRQVCATFAFQQYSLFELIMTISVHQRQGILLMLKSAALIRRTHSCCANLPLCLPY